VTDVLGLGLFCVQFLDTLATAAVPRARLARAAGPRDGDRIGGGLAGCVCVCVRARVRERACAPACACVPVPAPAAPACVRGVGRGCGVRGVGGAWALARCA
jgi:hypothetical protein